MSTKECIQIASNNQDILFNLLSLKHKLLLQKQKCDNCHQLSNKWMAIGVCHEIICTNCVNVEENICPKCKKSYDPDKHVTTSHKLREEYGKMEEFVWADFALRNGTLDELHQTRRQSSSRSENNSTSNERNAHIINVTKKSSLKRKRKNSKEETKNVKSVNDDINNKLNSITIKESNLCTEIVPLSQQLDISEIQSSSNYSISQSSTNLFDNNIPEVEHLQSFNREEIFDRSVQDDKDKDKDSTIITFENNSKESDDDDIIEGTPEKCDASINLGSPNSCISEQTHKRIVIAHSNMEHDDLIIIRKFADLFDCDAYTKWNDSITHLIINTDDDKCVRTKKFYNALLSHCFIVSFEWAKASLLAKTLLPETNYMPNDSSGRPSPLISWQVGRGLIKSPMEWTKDCMLFFHSSLKFNKEYGSFIRWAKKSGFKLVDDIKNFKEEYKMRFIIIEKFDSKDAYTYMNWINEFKVIPLYLDWFFECLCQYKLVLITPYFHILPLHSDMVELTGMDASLFLFDDDISD